MSVDIQDVPKTPLYRADLHGTQNKLCAWRRNMTPRLQVDNIFTFICQVAPVLACWLFKCKN